MTFDRLKTLIRKGYFPKELPSVFVTEDFGNHVRDIIKEWEITGAIPNDYNVARYQWKRLINTEPEVFSIPKSIHEHRYLHITHPVSQAMLSYVISKNWGTISKWLRRAKYSFDETIVSDNSERAVPEPNFLNHQIHKQQIESCATWVVKSDITRFYPSVYTHSIPWAAYGKEKVKKNLSDYRGSLADQLDILVRKGNRNQTIGIPIGPDTSRILADIISARVDNEVYKEVSLSSDHFDRLQDDWLVGCSSLEEAETALSIVRLTYQKMGLDINGNKTSISHLGQQRNPPWVGILRSNLDKNLKGVALNDLCSTALSLQAEYPNDRVLNYLLAAFYNKDFSGKDIAILETFLLKAIIVNPKVTDTVCKLLLNYIYEDRPINSDRVKKRFIPFVEHALENGRDFEACWGLYTLRGLKEKLDIKNIIDLSKDYEGSAVPLILLDMKNKGYVKKLPVAYWERLVKQSDMQDWTWLLAYEGVRHGWLRDPSNTVRNHRFLKPLYDRGVVFYDDSKNVLKRSVIVEKRRRIQSYKRKMLASFLFGYD